MVGGRGGGALAPISKKYCKVLFMLQMLILIKRSIYALFCDVVSLTCTLQIPSLPPHPRKKILRVPTLVRVDKFRYD